VKKFKLDFARRAEIHFAAIRAFISERDGPWKADSAVLKLIKACRSLETIPFQGIARPDLGPGLRSLRIGKRATIVFEVLEPAGIVAIYGVFTGGRDIEAYFKCH
jgi:plasmid stabilization system protein ParE